MWNPPELQNMALSLLLTVICWMFVDSESAGSVQRNVSAVQGQTVSLPCEAPYNDKTILVVEWIRLDLKDHYVFLYRDGHFYPDNHPSYKNRVDLKDRTMKDRDMTLILKNVAFSDRGTYECFVVQRGENGNNHNSLSLVSLSVDPGDPEGPGGRGGGRGRVSLTVAALVVVGIFGVLMFLKHQKKKKSLLPADSDPDLDERFDPKSPNNVL